METENLISIELICVNHNIEYSFINSLNEYGLIEITTVENTQYIFKENIKDLEKMIRLHYELDINMEGIDAISHLLQRVDNLHEELTSLKNRLRLYENE